MARKPRESSAAAQDGVKAALVAYLKRAQAAIEASMADKKTRLPEGGVAGELEVQISGDLSVGKAVPEGEPVTVADVADGELAAALLAQISDDARTAAVGAAVGLVAEARKKGEPAAKAKGILEESGARLAELVLACAKRRRIAKEVRRPARAGSVSGKPGVVVRGTVNAHTVELEVS